jgi:hypothetical protein
MKPKPHELTLRAYLHNARNVVEALARIYPNSPRVAYLHGAIVAMHTVGTTNHAAMMALQPTLHKLKVTDSAYVQQLRDACLLIIRFCELQEGAK